MCDLPCLNKRNMQSYANYFKAEVTTFNVERLRYYQYPVSFCVSKQNLVLLSASISSKILLEERKRKAQNFEQKEEIVQIVTLKS